ncbi:hypothetical protein NKH11_06390 [Mesorhizobium sp. M1393]
MAAGALLPPWLGLDDDLDPLQMRRERLARSRSTSRLACRSCGLELGLNRAEPGLDFVEGEGLLVPFELLGAATEAARSSCLTIP